MKLWKNYSLSIILVLLFLFSWGGQLVFQWQEFAQNQQQHNQSIKVDEFIPEFLSRTFENWQSEFLQVLTFVVLTTYFIHKGSHESRDTDDEMKRQLDRIERLLKSKTAAKSRR